MSFNPSKCNTINVTRKEDPIVTVYTLKDESLENVQVASYQGYKSQMIYHGIVMLRRCLQRATSHWGLSGATLELHPKQQNSSILDFSETVTGVCFLCLGSPLKNTSVKPLKRFSAGLDAMSVVCTSERLLSQIRRQHLDGTPLSNDV